VEKTTWQNDGNGNFRSTVLIHAPDKQSFASEYQSYLKQWQLLTHPAAFRIAEFHINPSDLAMQTQIVLTGFSEDYEPIGNRLSFLTPLEKAAILQQSADLAFYMQKQGISQQTWDMENLYIHKSGICQWLPSIAGSRIANEKTPDILMSLALMLFDLPVPQTDADWRDLKLTWDTDEKTDGKLPQEWIVFIKNLSMQTDSDFGNIFKFVFFQSWLYDMAVQFLMKDKQLSLPQSDLLKHLRLFLGIDEKQAESLAIISHKSDILWTDLKTASNGETLTTSGPEPPKKSSLSFHPDRACNTIEEHIGQESREEIVFRAYGRLGTDDIQSFAIIGFSKEGKTSLVNYIRQPKVMERYLVENADTYTFLYINLRHGNISDVAGFFNALYKEVRNIWDIGRLKDGSDLERITEYLNKNNRKLVVILDSFDQVILNQKFPVKFYGNLRSWFSTNKNVGCILTSPNELQKLNASFELLDSPFFNIFQSYMIGPLTRIEAEYLIRSRLPDSMADKKDDIAGRLVDEFGCRPYPLHVAGKFWTEHFLRKEKNPLDSAIEETYKELKANGHYEEIFTHIGANKIRSVLERRTTSDDRLIKLGWVRKGENGDEISSKQLERFFKEKLGIRREGIWGNIRRLISGRK